jgi:sulfate adenylyltransferase
MPDLASIAGLPQWHPPLPVLEFAELVLTGVLPAMPPGLPEPPGSLAGSPARPVVLEDAEGTPVAVWDPADPAADDADRPALSPVRPFAHGPLRAARKTPEQVALELGAASGVQGASGGGGGVLGVPLSGSVTIGDVSEIHAHAARSHQQILWLAVIGDGRTRDLPPVALWRAVQALAGVCVPLILPVPPSGTPDRDLIEAAARAFGATEIWPGLGSAGDGVNRAPEVPDAQPIHDMHPVFEQELQRMARPGRYPGATIFFTGLSGSGKSTVASALAERIGAGSAEYPARVVSLLDGDEVRRMLSAGLGFSRADRDLNILRIGYVAAEVTRHGGLAICAPIAPFDATRQQVRERVSAAGDFVLIHVSTPLEECERRDRKGLYAKARAGQIPEFTGISSPYETPEDADLRLDTSAMSVDDAVEQVFALMHKRGLFSPV